PDTVADEDLPAKRAEQDDPLHHAHEPEREVGPLQEEPRVLQTAEEDAHQEDGERVVPAERGDDDARVAVVRALEPLRAGGEAARQVAALARAPSAPALAGAV